MSLPVRLGPDVQGNSSIWIDIPDLERAPEPSGPLAPVPAGTNLPGRITTCPFEATATHLSALVDGGLTARAAVRVPVGSSPSWSAGGDLPTVLLPSQPLSNAAVAPAGHVRLVGSGALEEVRPTGSAP
jgi:hypothetical protein